MFSGIAAVCRMYLLKRVTVEGFRSIASATVELRPLNVLAGANGAGKSNLIAFLQMAAFALSRGLQTYVQNRGPASALLRFGPEATPVLHGALEFQGEGLASTYRFSLAPAQGDTLVFTHEALESHGPGKVEPKVAPSGGGVHRESVLAELAGVQDPALGDLKALLGKCPVHQFRGGSLGVHLWSTPRLDDNLCLRPDGSNLAAFLFRLRSEYSQVYEEIKRTINSALPWFEDFVLAPKGDVDRQTVPLRWRTTYRPDCAFSAGQLSDGAFRYFCLVTLLLQPEALRPRLLLLEEPELGLHPAAMAMVAGLVQAASRTSQVVLSTQSPTLLDHFAPEEIIVVENDQGCSTYGRREPEALRAWLDGYTFGQVRRRHLRLAFLARSARMGPCA